MRSYELIISRRGGARLKPLKMSSLSRTAAGRCTERAQRNVLSRPRHESTGHNSTKRLRLPTDDVGTDIVLLSRVTITLYDICLRQIDFCFHIITKLISGFLVEYSKQREPPPRRRDDNNNNMLSCTLQRRGARNPAAGVTR